MREGNRQSGGLKDVPEGPRPQVAIHGQAALAVRRNAGAVEIFPDPKTAEVARLAARVTALETQNREIREVLAGVLAKLEALRRATGQGV